MESFHRKKGVARELLKKEKIILGQGHLFLGEGNRGCEGFLSRRLPLLFAGDGEGPRGGYLLGPDQKILAWLMLLGIKSGFGIMGFFFFFHERHHLGPVIFSSTLLHRDVPQFLHL